MLTTMLIKRSDHIEYRRCRRCGGDVQLRGDYPSCVQCGHEDYSRPIQQGPIRTNVFKRMEAERDAEEERRRERFGAKYLAQIERDYRPVVVPEPEVKVNDCACGQEMRFGYMTMCGTCFWALSARDRERHVDGSPEEFASGRWW